MQRYMLGNRAQFTQTCPSYAHSSPHISPKNPSPSVFEATGLPDPSADFYPPAWEAHPILPAPPRRRPQKWRQSSCPGRDSLAITPTSLVDDGAGWNGRGPSRSVNSVFPGVDSWPTTPVLVATTIVIPPRVPASGFIPLLVLAPVVTTPLPTVASHSPVNSPVVSPVTSSVKTPVTPLRYTPSPLRYPTTRSPEPPTKRRPASQDDADDHGGPWYSWLFCVRRKARKERGSLPLREVRF